MTNYAALDVSLETTAVCVFDQDGRIFAERKVPTCPDAIASWLANNASDLGRVGMETGPLTVCLWNELYEKGLPIICMDARHANAACWPRGKFWSARVLKSKMKSAFFCAPSEFCSENRSAASPGAWTRSSTVNSLHRPL